MSDTSDKHRRLIKLSIFTAQSRQRRALRGAESRRRVVSAAASILPKQHHGNVGVAGIDGRARRVRSRVQLIVDGVRRAAVPSFDRGPSDRQLHQPVREEQILHRGDSERSLRVRQGEAMSIGDS